MADLVTLEEYKDAEGIITTKDDTRLSALIVSVSQLVRLIVEIVSLIFILWIKQKHSILTMKHMLYNLLKVQLLKYHLYK